MSDASTIRQQRRKLVGDMFPTGIPCLWCPLLTHYRGDGSPDLARIEAHLQFLAPDVGGLLVPGSTGDGWEMSPDAQRRLLADLLRLTRPLGLPVLAGVLRTSTGEMLQAVDELSAGYGISADASSAALREHGICGITVCPPRGADLTAQQIESSLAQVLQRNLPTALYQLPQVTENEMTTEVVERLAARFSNFFLLKDTSGQDRLALSTADLDDVFLVRGAEGDYRRWIQAGEGPYQGLLLSTANCFARQYHQMFAAEDAGDGVSAAQIIQPVEQVVAAAFTAVADEPCGNAFANANKAIDHFLAHGPRADAAPLPIVFGGGRLSRQTLTRVGQALSDANLLPETGYLERF